MTTATACRESVHPRLGFGLFGGAFAWLMHLVAASLIAEWGCVSGLHRYQFLGITAIAWAVIVLSVAAMLVAAAATWSVFRLHGQSHQWARDEQNSSVYDRGGTERFLTRVGLWSSVLFVFIIAAQTYPIFYFLSDC